MRIAFFLIPKAETAFVFAGNTMRQALEKMEYHKYTAVPVLDEEGRYQYTLTSTDFLWFMKNHNDLKFFDTENIQLNEITPGTSIKAVHIDDTMENLARKAIEQNFIPVVDDYGTYIGQVQRKDIIEYCLPMFDKSNEDDLDIKYQAHKAQQASKAKLVESN